MANEMIKFLRGNVASLPTTATPGAVYFTKDEGLYLGLEDGSYHRYGDFITVADVNSLPADGAHETCMYYCVAENILAKWDETAGTWTQINKQKTLAELGGVAKSVYEAKMAALEKADTDNATAIANLSTYVGTIPNGEDGNPMAASVVAYINKKTDGIATSGNLEALGNRVTSAETDIDNLQAAIAEGGSVANAIADAKAAGDAAQADVDALEGKVGTVAEGKTVVGLIGEAQAKADQGVADAATAQARADEAYNLANGKATIDQVNTAIAGAGHAVKSEVDTAIENLDKAYKAADETLQGNIDKKVDQTAYDTKVAELAGADTTLQGNIDALADKVGTPTEGKTIVEMIADAQTAATYDDTQVKADIKANADAIDVIEKDYLKGEDKTELAGLITAEENRAKGIESGLRTDVDAIKGDYLKQADKDELQGNIDTVSNAVERLTNGVSADEVDGVNDLINYVKEHGPEVTAIQDDIKENADAIAAINNENTGILKQAKDYADGLAGNYAEAEHDHVVADITDFDATVKSKIEAYDYATTGYVDQAEADAKTHADTEIAKDRARLDALELIDHDHSNKDVLDGITAAQVEAWDAAEQNAKDYVDDAIEEIGIGDYIKKADADAAYATAGHDHDDKYDAKGAAATAEQNAKDYADGLKSTIDTAYAAADAALKTELQGYADQAEADAKSEATNALAAAKTELEGKITAAETAAKGHADTEAGKVQTALDQYKESNNAAVALKANSADVYTKAQTYTQDEVDALLTSAMSWGSF